MLSGGERTRLALAKVMADPVNLLVLDEPTNHLDLPSCDLLEDALSVYPGTVLLVTHDRHLIRSVADALVEVRGGRARWSDGVDEAVLAPGGTTSRRATAPPRAAAPAAAPAAGRGSGGRDRAARRDTAEARNRRGAALKPAKQRLAKAERAWEKAEHRVAELQAQLADPDVYADADKVKELVARHDAAKTVASEAMSEWEIAAAALEDVERQS